MVIGQEDKLPLYEYRCKKCGGVIEKIQKFSAPEITCIDVHEPSRLAPGIPVILRSKPSYQDYPAEVGAE